MQTQNCTQNASHPILNNAKCLDTTHLRASLIPSPSFVFGVLLATLYGALFHLWRGGDGRRLMAYLLAAWLGFGIGQIVADALNLSAFSIGQVHVLTGTFGSWLGLAVTGSLVSGPSADRK